MASFARLAALRPHSIRIRVSACRFTFADDRQGRTPRASNGWAAQWRGLSPSAPSASLPPSAIIAFLSFLLRVLCAPCVFSVLILFSFSLFSPPCFFALFRQKSPSTAPP